MQKEVFTIGYEGSSLEDFLATLMLKDIEVLVDIRDVPLSRKKGFSKNILADALEQNNIEYVHLRGLGDPKEGRDAARSGDHDKFLKIFTTHLNSEAAQIDLLKATDIALNQKAVFLCYERDPICCHRNIVVKKLVKETDQKITHLGVKQGASYEVTLYLDDTYDYA